LCEHEGVQIVIAREAGKVLARMQAKDIREAIKKVAAIRPRRTTICVPSEAYRTGSAFGSGTGAYRTRSITGLAS
jgi:hypothetical protein